MLYAKNKDVVGLRLKENCEICICANKSRVSHQMFSKRWIFTVRGTLPGDGERWGARWEHQTSIPALQGARARVRGMGKLINSSSHLRILSF